MVKIKRVAKKRPKIKVGGTLHAALRAMIENGVTRFCDLRSSPACARNLQLLLMYGLADRATEPAKRPGISFKREKRRIDKLKKVTVGYKQEMVKYRKERMAWNQSLDRVLGIGSPPTQPQLVDFSDHLPKPSKLRRGVNKVMYHATDAGCRVFDQLEECKEYYLETDVPLSKKWCKHFANHVW